MSKLKLLSILNLMLGLIVGCATTKPDKEELSNEKQVIAESKKSSSITDDIKINGQDPKGYIETNSKVIFDQTDNKGIARVVTIVTRKPGTRSPVHVMNYPVTSCVTKGQATMYLDGESPETTKAGHCYVMPAGIKGYIYNSGKTELQLTDYKVFPAGEEFSYRIEH